MDCLDENLLAILADGKLDDATLSDVEAHLDTCGDCARLAAVFGRAVMATNAGGDFEGREAAPGDQIGRYKVTAWLGRGAMGQVYVAQDPSLERKVALKLVSAVGNAHLEERLGKEARAMAQLSDHPNVVTVYDVGQVGSRTFVAMELVRGSSLEKRLAQGELGWRDILKLFIPAGYGLCAAHRAGIVHRDFKPGNVLIGEDGMIKVGDFGLATDAPGVHTGNVWPKASTMAGTPAYMSPEQHRGESADAASDQFSFAIALWESLYGQRPFAGETGAAIRESVLSGIRREQPSSKVPDEVARILDKALAPDPFDRYPSLDVMLDRLERYAHPTRARWIVGGSLAALAVALGLFVALGDDHAACPSADARLASVWGQGQRQAIAHNLSTSPRPRAKELASAASATLDRYGQQWLSAHQSVCRATHVAHEQSAALLDQRMQCLDGRLLDFSELIALLRTDASLLDSSLEAADGLIAASTCVTQEPGDGAADRVTDDDDATALLARAQARLLAGRYSEVVEILGEAGAAFQSKSPRARARFEWIRGQALAELFQRQEAEAALRSAAKYAAQVRDARSVAQAWTRLAYVVGVQQGDYDAALIWVEAAESELERVNDEEMRLELWQQKALLLHEKGDHLEAMRLGERALTRARPLAAQAPLRYASTLLLQAGLWRTAGQLNDAQRALNEVLETRIELLGPHHPSTARVRQQLAQVFRSQGDAESALASQEQATADLQAAFGPEHAVVADARAKLAQILLGLGRISEAESALSASESVLTDAHADLRDRSFFAVVLGSLRIRQGRIDDAIEAFRTARALWIEHGGTEDHVQVANLSTRLGTALVIAKRFEEAEPLLQQALATHEKFDGAMGSDLAPILHYLSEIRLQQGDCAGAMPLLERSARVIEKNAGPDHFNMSFPLMLLADCLHQAGDDAAAITKLQRALAIREGARRSALDVIEVKFALLRSRYLVGEKKAATKMARELLDELETEQGSDPVQASIRSWLRTPGKF